MLKRLSVPAAFLVVAVALAGCRYEGTIDEKGGAQVKLHFRTAPNATIEKISKDLESKDVKLVSRSMDKDNWVDATVEVADVSKLSTASYFRAWTFKLADGKEKGTKTLTATFTNKTPNLKLPPDSLEYYGKEITIALTVPGDIVSTNATEKKDRTATWTFQAEPFFKEKSTTLEITYKLDAAEK